MERNTILIGIVIIGILMFLNAGLKDNLGGEIKITDIPLEVKPNTIFNIQGYFIPDVDGKYLLEAGPVLCLGGTCQGNVYDRAALITADKSACDGNVHYSGVFEDLKKGEKYIFSLNLESSDILGEYTYQAYVYDKCEANGGVMLSGSERKIIKVNNHARAVEIINGNREGTINDAFDKVANFWDSIVSSWENTHSYIRFILGGLFLIFCTVFVTFPPEKKPNPGQKGVNIYRR